MIKPTHHSYSNQEAIRRYNSGEKCSCSTHLDEDTIIAGYGNLSNDNYNFEYPLPEEYIIKEYGTTSWTVYRKRKMVEKLITSAPTLSYEKLKQIERIIDSKEIDIE